MLVLKVTIFFLVALTVRAEKKIELQDIENDNLRSEVRSENEKEQEKPDGLQSSGSGSDPGVNSLDFLKSGLLRYFHNSASSPQRYIQQYAVHEQPEKPAHGVKEHHGPPVAQQAMVGYLSNFPMQIYLVPQYYTDQSHQSHQHTHRPHVPQIQHYQAHASNSIPTRVAESQTGHEAVQLQSNYIDVASYLQPTGKTFVQSYTPNTQAVTYVTYPTQPTAPAPQVTVAPVGAHHPVLQYDPGLVSFTPPSKVYYPNLEYSDTNAVNDVGDQEPEPKQYSSQAEPQYHVPNFHDYPRHYNSRAPISEPLVREEYRNQPAPVLPHPNPLLLKAPPPHLAHLAKTLPMYRPVNRPIYQGPNHIPNTFTPRPHDRYVTPPRRRPASLIDSYIPSSVQIEYLKRGLVKEPGAVYDAIASGRLPPIPRHYERGFVPNQMYHTAAGGVAYGHLKRTAKPNSHK